MTILRLIPLWLDLLKWINENENEDDQNMEKATRLSCRLMHRTPQSAYHVARYHHPPLWQQDWKTWFFIQVNSSPTNGELECDLKCWYLSTDQCVQGEIHRPSLCSSIPTLSDRVWQQWLMPVAKSPSSPDPLQCVAMVPYFVHMCDDGISHIVWSTSQLRSLSSQSFLKRVDAVWFGLLLPN